MIKELFIEFLSLGYYKKGIKQNYLRDINLGNYIIARLSDLGCSVLYLTSGNRFDISWRWLDLFNSFNIFCGERIRVKNITIDKDCDNVDQIIYYFTQLVDNLNNKNGELVLDLLSNIVVTKTSDFRKWYLKKTNEILEPIEFSSLNKKMNL